MRKMVACKSHLSGWLRLFVPTFREGGGDLWMSFVLWMWRWFYLQVAETPQPTYYNISGILGAQKPSFECLCTCQSLCHLCSAFSPCLCALPLHLAFIHCPCAQSLHPAFVPFAPRLCAQSLHLSFMPSLYTFCTQSLHHYLVPFSGTIFWLHCLLYCPVSSSFSSSTTWFLYPAHYLA